MLCSYSVCASFSSHTPGSCSSVFQLPVLFSALNVGWPVPRPYPQDSSSCCSLCLLQMPLSHSCPGLKSPSVIADIGSQLHLCPQLSRRASLSVSHHCQDWEGDQRGPHHGQLREAEQSFQLRICVQQTAGWVGCTSVRKTVLSLLA